MAALTPPATYTNFTLPDVKFAHHPASSPTVTPIVLVILNRPAARNAFTDSMADSLEAAFTLLSADPRVKCLVLTGSDQSNQYYCVGMDLASAGSRKVNTAIPRDEYRDGGGRVTLSMHRCAKPIIAAINGSAVGVGITMTLPASIRVVSNKAKVGFVSFFLPRLVGTSRAMHLVTTGGVYPATSPLFGDLFSEIVEPGEVLPRALAIAEEVAENVSAVSTKVNKELIYRNPGTPEEAHLLESSLFWDLIRGRDSKEGMQSFLDKRAPKFAASIDKDAPTAYPWWEEKQTKSKL
ncbi:enoyl-CoA hydratase/isomerase [Verticillium dahliae]